MNRSEAIFKSNDYELIAKNNINNEYNTDNPREQYPKIKYTGPARANSLRLGSTQAKAIIAISGARTPMMLHTKSVTAELRIDF